MRVFSNFSVRYNDGSLHRIPVNYGDADRQVANIIKENSENKMNSIPKISIYISSLALDWTRSFDQTYIGKSTIRERVYDPTTKSYTHEPGINYTIERPAPTPFKLTMKVDIWSSSTAQKLEILEQLLVLFNPALEFQTTDNYLDWTSLSVLYLNDINWSSKAIPVGTDTPIDIATLTVETPIWISPPVRITRAGIITRIITSMYDANQVDFTPLLDGDNPFDEGFINNDALLTRTIALVEDYNLHVIGNTAVLIDKDSGIVDSGFDLPETNLNYVNWLPVIQEFKQEYIDGLGKIYLDQGNGYEVVGTFKISVADPAIIDIKWDTNSLMKNTGIDSAGILDYEPGYNPTLRPNSPGTFDAIINPLEYNPHRPLKQETDQAIITGIRYMLLDNIGHISNIDVSSAWGSLIAYENDIVEYNGTQWNVIFESRKRFENMIWQTNTYSGIQYIWNGIAWLRSYEGIYKSGKWRLEL